MTNELKRTDRTAISRHPERANYERDSAYGIFDEGLVAHVGFDSGNGVIVIPMTYARVGDELFLHGAVASRWLSSFGDGLDISVCVTLLDGLVLARSAFSHSMNYRSVVAFGKAVPVSDDVQKQTAFKALLDHLLPGRWDDCRQPDKKEFGATIVLAMPLNEASVKIRSGPPKDAAKDLDLDYWAGVIPLSLEAGAPVADETGADRKALPSYVGNYRRIRR